ncbi:Nuclear pore assembly and biogenesis protein APQ12 [Penicillium malachiteum]|uniref:Nuclear pore assembly and biogenesis protein APQ12 n=1 Tax=Penicillium malachiteum TaxID=1324776 RepID=UPI00254824F4|nr:Nuclear pore assembly and biogenesis protein APQ12 [Penicillium malachiteum]KAJ5713976.1 Nuclear pore assembly and biogenesis protein APQ12 [Penicillium malachiteum]
MDFLPENIQSFLQHPTVSYIRSTTQDQITTHLSNIRTAYVQPYLIAPLSTLLTTTSTAAMPDLMTVLIMVVILFFSLKLLDYMRRLVMFWVTLAFQVLFWGSVLGLGWYVYTVGVENAGRDLGWIWGVVMGFVQDFQARAAASSGGKSGAGTGSWKKGGGWS